MTSMSDFKQVSHPVWEHLYYINLKYENQRRCHNSTEKTSLTPSTSMVTQITSTQQTAHRMTHKRRVHAHDIQQHKKLAEGTHSPLTLCSGVYPRLYGIRLRIDSCSTCARSLMLLELHQLHEKSMAYSRVP